MWQLYVTFILTSLKADDNTIIKDIRLAVTFNKKEIDIDKRMCF